MPLSPQHTPVPMAHSAQPSRNHSVVSVCRESSTLLLGWGLVPETEHMHWDVSSAPVTWLSLTVLALWQGSQI